MNRYVQKQLNILAPFLAGAKTVLDFGCGDLSLAKALHSTFPQLAITAVDVVDSGIRVPGIPFKLYDGKRLPFGNRAFDVSISYHVFHHCFDPREAYGEVLRVTRKKLLMVEPVYRNKTDRFFLNIADRIANAWRRTRIPMPFTFQSEATWRRFAREFHWVVEHSASVGVLPRFLPIGETKLFVLASGT